ncbi:MAG: hypothetical protein R6V77_00800 [Candidatus Cloacimonadaceae bacterium]
MVQRTRLVIILLLALAAGILSAQESGFTPPFLASEALLELPSDWVEDYSPAETVILVSIKADSTTTLVKILDGKTELQPLIENLIPTLQFIPAFVEGNAIDASLTLKLSLVKRQQTRSPYLKAVSDSLRQVDKAVLDNWINRQRKSENLQQIFSSDTSAEDVFAPQTYDTLYRTNFFMMGLNSRPYVIMKDGFLQPARLCYNAPAFQLLSNFRSVQTEGSLISFANEKYDLPVMLTDVYAGLGDYEFNFARVQVVKNHLLGVEDFYTEVGLLVQNGYWQEVISDQTSTRAFLSLPILGTKLSANYEKYDLNIPSTTLLPGLQSNSLFQIGQKLSSLYVKWQLPWLTLGWQTETEKFSSFGNMTAQEYKSSQLLLARDYKTKFADAGLTYQYNYKNDLPELQQLYQYNLRPEHQVLLKVDKKIADFDYETQAAVSEEGLDLVNLEAGYTSFIGRLGAVFAAYNGVTDTKTDNYLYADSVLSFPTAFIKNKVGLNYKFKQEPSRMGLNFEFGSKNLSTSRYDYVVNDVVTSDFACFYAEALLQYSLSLGRYTFSYEQTQQWDQYHKEMLEQPEFQGQARFEVTRDMGYENTLSGGMNLTGHSDYRMADKTFYPVFGAIVADAWLGVKITDLFEFQLMMKNLGGNILYGLSPHPRTILGTIHWFYLN